ncbi:MAG: endonuclease III [Spirochaetaceae bacterium]|nr:endonuclease III [Spirochaetaceae bacterium]
MKKKAAKKPAGSPGRMAPAAWEKIFRDLRERLGRAAEKKFFPSEEAAGPSAREKLPSVSQVAADHPGESFRVLVSTMISLRTKDEVTYAAAQRLFARAANPSALAALPEKEIAKLIYPAGFYRIKAASIRETARRIAEDYGGKVPADRDLLMAFPGVGRKTANLVLSLGFGIDAICVDTHVHRISNRTGWAETKTPEETEAALCARVPRKFWIPINELLVKYGQSVCTPASPHCGSCPLAADRCKKRGVTRQRD